MTINKSADLAARVLTFALQECGFKINVMQIINVVGGKLTTQAETRPGGRWRIGLLILFLLVLKSSEDPTSLNLVELPVLVKFDCQDPSACDKVLALVLSHVYNLINMILFLP